MIPTPLAVSHLNLADGVSLLLRDKCELTESTRPEVRDNFRADLIRQHLQGSAARLQATIIDVGSSIRVRKFPSGPPA